MSKLAETIKEVQDSLNDQEQEIEALFGNYNVEEQPEIHPLVMEIVKLLQSNKILMVPVYEFIRNKLDTIEECKGVTIFGRERWELMKESMSGAK